MNGLLFGPDQGQSEIENSDLALSPLLTVAYRVMSNKRISRKAASPWAFILLFDVKNKSRHRRRSVVGLITIARRQSTQTALAEISDRTHSLRISKAQPMRILY